jgi:TPR repeat protein
LQHCADAALRGDAPAQLLIARAERALDEDDQPQQATHWISAAAAHGFIPAMEELAFAMLRGDGVAKDPKKGLAMLESVAIAGRQSARILLAQLYASSDDLPHDPVRALMWCDVVLEKTNPLPPAGDLLVLLHLRHELTAGMGKAEIAEAERQASRF